jgi:hypothetical protein
MFNLSICETSFEPSRFTNARFASQFVFIEFVTPADSTLHSNFASSSMARQNRLTDLISVVVMKKLGITDGLDRGPPFPYAGLGFRTLPE